MTIQKNNNCWQEWILWLLRRRTLMRVINNSMKPTLQPGDLVLVNPYAYREQPPLVDDIVVALHPSVTHPKKPDQMLKIIKRVEAVSEAGTYFLRSDNSLEGSDSRVFGAVSEDQIVGRVTCVVSLG
ncbi:MAG: nickel-type superoxide dismutase maturation protease [Chloroflexota bacterium]